MLMYGYKLDGTKAQYSAIDEAIRITQFVRNKCLRLWMDTRGMNLFSAQAENRQAGWLKEEFPA